MITKERLKELINEESKVYVIDGRVKTIELDNYSIIIFGDVLEIPDGDGDTDWYNIEHLYEHKADAEWDLEFGNVEKRIKFVKPKPFREVEKSMIGLYNAHGFTMYLDSMDNYVRVYDERIDFYERDLIFQKPFTEEYYKEACRLIKKLFMGEE